MTKRDSPFGILDWHRWPIFIQLSLICLLLLLSGAVGSISVGRNDGDRELSIAEKLPQPIPFQHEPTYLPQPTLHYQIRLATLTDEGLSENAAFDTQVPRPPSISLPEGLIYYADGNRVYTYSLSSGEKNEVYVTSDPQKIIIEVKFLAPHYLYVTVTEVSENYSGRGDDVYIKEIDLSTQVSRLIGPVGTYIFGGATYLFRQGDTDVVASFGGDGCGGGGNFYKFKKEAVVKFAESGVGCSEAARYLGFTPETHRLVFAEVVPGTYNPIDPENYIRYDVLYLQNAVSGEKEPLLDLKTFPDIRKIILSDDRSIVAVISKSELVLYDLTKKRVVKTVPLAYSGTHWWLTQDFLYAADYNGRVFHKIDLGETTATTIPWGTVSPIGNSPEFLGLWEGEPLLYVFTQ